MQRSCTYPIPNPPPSSKQPTTPKEKSCNMTTLGYLHCAALRCNLFESICSLVVERFVIAKECDCARSQPITLYWPPPLISLSLGFSLPPFLFQWRPLLLVWGGYNSDDTPSFESVQVQKVNTSCVVLPPPPPKKVNKITCRWMVKPRNRSLMLTNVMIIKCQSFWGARVVNICVYICMF